MENKERNIITFARCIECRKPFTYKNTFTNAGWKETQISGYCEQCFDKLFKEDQDHER